MPLTTDIRAALQAYILEHGLRATARELDMSPAMLSMVVSGKRFPGSTNLDRICELLGLELRRESER